MLQEVNLKVTKREVGKQISKRLRNENKVPGVFYSKNNKGINISANLKDLKPIVYTSNIKLVNLDIEGQQEKCLLKEVKFDPVTDKITHFDLLGIVEDRKVTISIPVEFIGEQPIGVRKGGRFQQVFHKFKITCLPKYLISSIQIDISKLDIGNAVYLNDLNLEGIEYSLPMDSLICSVNNPKGKAADDTSAENQDESEKE